MKENSIEDIKIIENFINWLTIDFEYDSGNEIKTIEHILLDYKRVLKENEELKADNYELNNRISDLLENIPTQKVKDKIEEFEKEGIKDE